MQILTVSTECYFMVGEKEIKPEELSKNDLLELFSSIYELEDINELQIPAESEIDNIKNPVEKEIVNQIVQKIKEFTDNLDQIKQDIDSSFPSLSAEN